MHFDYNLRNILLLVLSLTFTACSSNSDNPVSTAADVYTYAYDQKNYVLVETDGGLVAIDPTPPYQTQTLSGLQPQIGTLIPFRIEGNRVDTWLEVYPYYAYLDNGHFYLMDLDITKNLAIKQISNLTLTNGYCNFRMEEGNDLSTTTITVYQFDANQICSSDGFRINLAMDELASPQPVSNIIAPDPTQYPVMRKFDRLDNNTGRWDTDLFVYQSGSNLLLGSQSDASKQVILLSNVTQVDFTNAFNLTFSTADNVYYGEVYAVVDGALYAIDSLTESAYFVADLQSPFYAANQAVTSIESLTSIKNFIIDSGKLFEIQDSNKQYSLVEKPSFNFATATPYFEYFVNGEFLLINDGGELLTWGVHNQRATNITQVTGFDASLLFDSSFRNLLFYDKNTMTITSMNVLGGNQTVYSNSELQNFSILGKTTGNMYMTVNALGAQTQIGIFYLDSPNQNIALGPVDFSRDAIGYIDYQVQLTNDGQVFWELSESMNSTQHLYVTDSNTHALTELLPEVFNKFYVRKTNGSSVFL